MSEISRTVSTALQSLRQREHASRLAGQIADTASEVTTGLKSRPYEALGYKSADAIAIRMQITRNDGFIESNKLLAQRFAGLESALGGIRDAGQDVLEQLVFSEANGGSPSRNLSQIAQAAIDTITARAAYKDTSGFAMSGTMSDLIPLQPWDEVNPDTGLSPQGIIQGTVGPTITGTADAQAKIDELRTIYDSALVANPNSNFEATFYRGTDELDAGGQPNPFVEVQISPTEKITQPAQANNPAMRDLLRGLAMLAEVDVSAIADPDARALWMEEARSAIAGGLSGVTDLETGAGVTRGRLADTLNTQQVRAELLAAEQLALEGADQYDAAGRLTQLQTQLESSYAVTARLSRMSFLNYL